MFIKFKVLEAGSEVIFLVTNDVTHMNVNCKAEVTEVIERVNSKKSGRKNHRWRRRIKKHSRRSPEMQFKELNEKLRSTLPGQQINSTMTAKTQTKSSQKIEQLKQSNKLNKNILIENILIKLSTLTPKAKNGPFKYI